MRYMEFGKTGMIVSELGFGCIPIIRLDVDVAVEVLRRAYDRGITFYDTANAYRDSEEKIGRAFDGMRKKVFLATKTLRRDAEGAAKHLENSLRRLRTDYIDLYQLHQIAQEKDWNAVTAPGGALEAVVRAREEGKVRWIGVTSHNLSMALKLVRTGLFSSIQFPFNFIEENGNNELIPAACEQGLGILAMKPFAGGMIDNAGIAFKFLRKYPNVLPIPGYDSVDSVEEVVSLYRQPNVVTAEDLRLMDHYRVELGKEFCRRCEYCQPCPSGVMITIAMGYRIVASRMSPAVSVEFCRPAMESVKLCDNCGICVERCPYELPIPDMLKLNYDLYEKHVADLR
ncbi:MAG: aldo/keto reductase [Deltaproteobacteria bacterium]|nr:aldo/keto reductase [Deltaproteobacteria bacterium]